MPELTLTNVDERLVRRLSERAEEHGLSIEEEHRRILLQALGEERDRSNANISFKEYLLRIPDVGDDSLFERNKALPVRGSESNLFED